MDASENASVNMPAHSHESTCAPSPFRKNREHARISLCAESAKQASLHTFALEREHVLNRFDARLDRQLVLDITIGIALRLNAQRRRRTEFVSRQWQ
eukprot:1653826-Pleurochrysis_carterae.AAC.1